MTTLRKHLLGLKKIVDENPNALDMEIIAVSTSSGQPDGVSSAFIRKVDDEISDIFSIDAGDSFIELCIG